MQLFYSSAGRIIPLVFPQEEEYLQLRYRKKNKSSFPIGRRIHPAFSKKQNICSSFKGRIILAALPQEYENLHLFYRKNNTFSVSAGRKIPAAPL